MRLFIVWAFLFSYGSVCEVMEYCVVTNVRNMESDSLDFMFILFSVGVFLCFLQDIKKLIK